MWFITLLILALAAYLIIKAVKAQATRKALDEAQGAENSGLTGSLQHDSMATQSPAQENSGDERAATAVPKDSGTQAGTDVDESTDNTESGQDEGNRLSDIREMLETLNLTESGAEQLGISREQFNALKSDHDAEEYSSALPSSDAQKEIAGKLKRMLA
ncbi:MAG: hypothetical protein HKN42_00495 [Granulosicoccus sp.]|nr:hypothetical protein [Granulosicoccus sp.]